MDQLDEIKRKIDIVDFISGYLELKKAGRNFKALCPFHSEKTPSFMVSPERQIWHCFGCGAGGDIFGFLMQMERIEFGEALQILAEKAGIVLKRYDPKIATKKTQLFEANKLAAIYFHKMLTETKAGKSVQDYLKSRKISSKTIKDFYLGYAPDSFHNLTEILKKKGFSDGEIYDAGLIIQKENRSYYNRFRNRLMFPFCDTQGRIIGFSARALKEGDEPKYLNSPQTLIFDKSRSLYGINLAKDEIKKQNQVIVVEGQMDTISSHQAGISNTVSSSGTALTSHQIEQIKKFTPNIILAFDKDSAGDTATKRGIEEAISQGANVKIAILPFGKDPDECIKKDPNLFKKSIKEALHFIEFYFETVFDKIKGRDVESKRQIGDELLPILAKIRNKIEQAHWISKLSESLGVEEKVISSALSDIKIVRIPKTEPQIWIGPKDKISEIEERLLGLVLSFPEYIIYLTCELVEEDFSQSDFKEIFRELKEIKDEFNLSQFQKKLSRKLASKIDIFTLGITDFYQEVDEKEIFEEVKSLVSRLRSIRVKKIKDRFEAEIKKAEREGNKKKAQELIKKFQDFLKKIK